VTETFNEPYKKDDDLSTTLLGLSAGKIDFKMQWVDKANKK